MSLSRPVRTLALALAAPLAWPIATRPQTPDYDPAAPATQPLDVVNQLFDRLEQLKPLD